VVQIYKTFVDYQVFGLICLNKRVIVLSLFKINNMDFIRIQGFNYSAIIQLKGAELTHFSSRDGQNLLWKVDEAFWNRCAPNLFPIVGKLKNNCYVWDGQSYQMKQHGFARDAVFSISAQSENKVSLQLTANEATKAQFPFDFQLTISFECSENGLVIQHTILNNGQSRLPFSLGGHPGFQLSDSLNNYKLVFPKAFSANRWLIDNGLYTGAYEEMKIDKELPLNNELFESDAIVFKRPPFQSVDLVHITSGNVVHLSCENWDAVGFWTKKDAPFFCIEPWWGWADKTDHSGNLLEKKGLYWLEKGAHKIVEYIISA
jgi:galactose mutarotase-like enzyme